MPSGHFRHMYFWAHVCLSGDVHFSDNSPRLCSMIPTTTNGLALASFSIKTVGKYEKGFGSRFRFIDVFSFAVFGDGDRCGGRMP